VIIKGRVYDIMKFTAQVFLPALGTLYFAIAGIWGLPNAQEVMGTILAVDAFLGVLLGLSQLQYNNVKYDGVMTVVETEDAKSFTLAFDGDPHDIDKKKEVIFKVE
jgi:hypothetical protein